MLARIPRSRSTTDVDLAATTTSDLEEAIEALRECVAVDLGDHTTFTLAASRETGGTATQPGSQMRRLVFNCVDPPRAAPIGQVPVDLVVEPPPTGTVEVVEPANRMVLSKPLTAHPYRLFPIVDHIADKVCAIMADNYPGNRSSSRVKDLVDLVVIATTQQINLNQLRVAIATEAALRGMTLTTFEIPDGWATVYTTLAKNTPAASGIVDVIAAHTLVATLVNPALAPVSDAHAAGDTWSPPHGWTDPTPSPNRAAGTQASTDDLVTVRAHIRDGHPVTSHTRSPRTPRPDR